MSHFSWFQGHYIVIEGSNHQAGLWNYGPRGCVFLDHPLGATPVDEESELCRLKERCAYIYISHIRLVAGLEHEFYVSIYWEQSSQLTNMFQRGWNHQPVYKPYLCRFKWIWVVTNFSHQKKVLHSVSGGGQPSEEHGGNQLHRQCGSSPALVCFFGVI